MSKLNRDGVGRSLERILEKQPTEVQTVAAANTAEGNEMTQVALYRNDKERAEIIQGVADINFVVATIIASAAFSALIQVPGGFDNKGLANLREKINFSYFLQCDAAAFCFSILSMLIHLWADEVGTPGLMRSLSSGLTLVSLVYFTRGFNLALELVTSKTLTDNFDSDLIWGNLLSILSALGLLIIATLKLYRKIIGILKTEACSKCHVSLRCRSSFDPKHYTSY